MIARLHVHNYQSIADADLELGRFTVIVGANSTGKSALMRALAALAFNETGSDFIRKGEREVEVSVETDAGVRVTWRKGVGKGASYTVDGQTFDRLGAAVPGPVQDALGVRRIEIDPTTTITPQFHEQGDYGFLLRESPGKAARILAKLTKLDVVVSAQVECRRDLQRTRTEGKDAEAAAERLRERRDLLPDVAAAKALLDVAGAQVKIVRVDIARSINQLELDAERARARQAVSVRLPDPDMLLAIGEGLECAREGIGLARQLEQARAIQAVRLPKSEAFAALEERIEALTEIWSIARLHNQASQRLELAQSDFAQALATLEDLQAQWERIIAELDLCEHCPLRQGVPCEGGHSAANRHVLGGGNEQ